MDPARHLAFVTTRGDNGVSVVHTRSFTEQAHVTMHNPEPAAVTNGRKFLFDASLTSSRGSSYIPHRNCTHRHGHPRPRLRLFEGTVRLRLCI